MDNTKNIPGQPGFVLQVGGIAGVAVRPFAVGAVASFHLQHAQIDAHLDQLPLSMRDHLIPLCDRVSHYARLQNRLVRIAQDAVDQLQLDVKYLLFDLEATRRERDELREQLHAEGDHIDIDDED